MGTLWGITTMKNALSIVAALSLASLFTTTAAHANGVDFEGKCGGGTRAYAQAECQGFAAGVVAGIQISPHPNICFPANFDRRQSLPIVLNWMQQHPEMLNWGPALLIRQAFRETYPCGNAIPPIGN
jgi:hypothetical protein